MREGSDGGGGEGAFFEGEEAEEEVEEDCLEIL